MKTMLIYQISKLMLAHKSKLAPPFLQIQDRSKQTKYYRIDFEIKWQCGEDVNHLILCHDVLNLTIHHSQSEASKRPQRPKRQELNRHNKLSFKQSLLNWVHWLHQNTAALWRFRPHGGASVDSQIQRDSCCQQLSPAHTHTGDSSLLFCCCPELTLASDRCTANVGGGGFDFLWLFS